MFIIAHVRGVVCIYVCVLVKFRYQYLLASLVILHFIVGRSSFADPRLEDFIQTLWLTSPGDSPASAPFSIFLYVWLFPGILFIWAQVFSLKRLYLLSHLPISKVIQMLIIWLLLSPLKMLFSQTSDALGLFSRSFHYIIYYLFVR